MDTARWTAAFDAFDHNDVSPRDALGHLEEDLPHARLLELRRAPSAQHSAEARSLLEATRSAWLLEGFVAAPLERAAEREAALEARLALLPLVPRWESLTACYVLTRLARGALALGQAGLAAEAARRALRFLPLEPAALVVLAAALETLGEPSQAARVRAALWDARYGEEVLEGEPSELDRAASPLGLELDALEPMSLEDRARFAVMSIRDASFLECLTGLVRHASVQLRMGQAAQAWATLAALTHWSPQVSTPFHWLGLEAESPRRDLHRVALLDAIEATPAGAAAVAANRKKAPNVASKLSGYRLWGAEQAPIEDIEPGLTDFFIGVRQAARLRLGEHPLVRRARELEEAEPTWQPFYGGEALELYAEGQIIVGRWSPGRLENQAPSDSALSKLLRDGAHLDPRDGLPQPSVSSFAFIAPARVAKPSCKACKQPFELGEPQLRIYGRYEPSSKSVPYHLPCAKKGQPKAALEAARRRWRTG